MFIIVFIYVLQSDKKRFPMLCHILSIQVCRSTCFMKCKHTIKKVQLLQFYSEYTGWGGGWDKGLELVKSKVTLTAQSHRVCRECGTLIKYVAVALFNCPIAAEMPTSVSLRI